MIKNICFLSLLIICFHLDSFSMENSEYLALYNVAENLSLDEQEQPDIKSKYLDVYQRVNSLYLNSKLQELQQKYEEAKSKEQSLANRTLTAVTMAATGIGGMELAQGLSEQKADKDAEQDMTAYMETFRCEYGGGKSVKNGATNVELPADTLFDLYQEYITLAADVKAMKEQLDLAPGIESEVIIDKATAGLYDDKASEKSNGTYASIYRAKMGNETDQAKLQEMSDTSKKRVTGGAIAVAAGTLVGVVGNSLINGKYSKTDTNEVVENTTKLSKSSNELLKNKRTGTVLSTEDTNELLKAIQDKFK